jgi:hypothetical protein
MSLVFTCSLYILKGNDVNQGLFISRCKPLGLLGFTFVTFRVTFVFRSRHICKDLGKEGVDLPYLDLRFLSDRNATRKANLCCT